LQQCQFNANKEHKKKLEEVLQESVQGGPLRSQGVQLLKMELRHVVMFHRSKTKKLEMIIETNINLKDIQHQNKLEGSYKKGFPWGQNQRLFTKLFGTLLKNNIFGTIRLFCLKLGRMKFCNFKNILRNYNNFEIKKV
jgi:hypothetical protein